MPTDPPIQRSYRSTCPHCGAPVEFRSAASIVAVCGYCRSTLAREGEALRRIGQSAELFDDHSPLQLGVQGRWQKEAFSLVGRLQYRYRDGTWNEWHALFDSGRSAWLSEDNGRYVLVFPVPLSGPVPQAAALPMESRVVVNGQPWLVASVQRVALLAAQGELPRMPPPGGPDFVVAELRGARGEVLSLDYGDPAAPQATLGQGVRLAELGLTGLAADSLGREGGAAEKTLASRGLNCPNCGAALEIKLGSTRSIVCGQCRAVVDVSQDLGAPAHYLQESKGQRGPRIPLGTVGHLALGSQQPLPWQVVGYVERRDEEQTPWSEYLLYHRTEGFAFLVDAEDGWSWVVPLTGAPEHVGGSAKLRWQGVNYQQRYAYTAHVTYVMGEFYWRLRRGETSHNTDYTGTGSRQSNPLRLNRERTGQGEAAEVVWSAGATLDAGLVARAFGLPMPSVAAPSSASQPRRGCLTVVFWVCMILLVLWLISRCSSERCVDTVNPDGTVRRVCSSSGGGYHGSGGSYGGFSSGGSHK